MREGHTDCCKCGHDWTCASPAASAAAAAAASRQCVQEPDVALLAPRAAASVAASVAAGSAPPAFCFETVSPRSIWSSSNAAVETAMRAGICTAIKLQPKPWLFDTRC